MNKNQNEGAGRKLGGSIKEAVGKLTGNRKLETEGQIEKTTGSVQKAVGDTEKSIEKAVDKTKRAASD